MHLPSIALLTLVALPVPARESPLAYPPAVAGPAEETRFGLRVKDPYRWLEGDVRTEPAVADWVRAQNQVTEAYLATLPGRDALKARLAQLLDYERLTLPVARGGRLFFRRNSGLQNHSVLMVAEGSGAPRLLIDPNAWARDGSTALAEWSPSEDGKLLAYAVQNAGSDWRTVKVMVVATGKLLSDDLDWIKFSELAWRGDNSGFYYCRFPANPKGRDFLSSAVNHRVFFHRIGTPQTADTPIYATPDQPGYYQSATTTGDGRWLIVQSSAGAEDRYALRVQDLTAPGSRLITLMPTPQHDWRVVGAVGDTVYFLTNMDAPRYRVVAFDALAGTPRPVLAQGTDTLTDGAIVGNRLLVTALKDARTEVRRYTLSGIPDGTVPLTGVGTATGFAAIPGTATSFYAFTSYNVPTTIYRYDAVTNTSTIFNAPKVSFDPAAYVVRQIFATSKDGTQVPVFISHRRDLNLSKGAPTLLYGYGGFNINILPAFQIDALAWMEMGGVYGEANLRGGGEYGAEWHASGSRLQKQNVFDDFIAVGEHLIKTGITPKGGLAIQGGSNGGLLVGAVVNQRPELYAAALPAVGVMDMLRFPLFTAGRGWTADYGDPQEEAQFRNLLSYSPYHNIVPGKDYPAILVTTADTDDRVVPGHSFKYAAALQAAPIGQRPHLIRIETSAGHGSGKPTAKQLEETADLWAFSAYWTGLTRP